MSAPEVPVKVAGGKTVPGCTHRERFQMHRAPAGRMNRGGQHDFVTLMRPSGARSRVDSYRWVRPRTVFPPANIIGASGAARQGK